VTLGAHRWHIVGMIAAQAGWPLAGGVATGLVGAQMLGHLLDGYLLGISPRDPVAYAAVLVILAGTASAAMWIPAPRRSRRC
jgi:hypothetical protein